MAWEMEDSEAKLERGSKSRLEILSTFLKEPCVDTCGGQWQLCAENVLERNGISKRVFCMAIHQLLEHGRGKHRNLLITGPANCAKTFMLLPLTKIYNSFSNPATSTFAWVGADEAQIMFLNDFRWCQQIIAWHDLLLLLEGELVHLPAPKTHFSRDLVISGTIPIFATSKQQLIYIKGSMMDDRETEMMAVRWRHFIFHSQISEGEQKKISPCGHCFAKMIYENLQ